MSYDLVIRAWRDESYWLALGDEKRAEIPLNPAGSIELLDVELDRVVGGDEHQSYCTTDCNYSIYSGGAFCCG